MFWRTTHFILTYEIRTKFYYYSGKIVCCVERWSIESSSYHRSRKIHLLRAERGSHTWRICPRIEGGGVGQLTVPHMVVHQFKDDSLGHAFILDTYFSKLPANTQKQEIFYLHLIAVPVNPAIPWFTLGLIGKNALNKMVKIMCEGASVVGKKTNHSLQASGIVSSWSSRKGYSPKWTQVTSAYQRSNRQGLAMCW